MSLCQHIVEDEEVEGTVDGGACVVTDGRVNVGEGTIDIRRGRWDQGGEASSEGHGFVLIQSYSSGIYSKIKFVVHKDLLNLWLQ